MSDEERARALVDQAWLLLDELRHTLWRMTLPSNHPDAYNDYWCDRVEALVMKAQARYDRRAAAATTPPADASTPRAP